jgi:hypothetical protein
MLTLPWTVPSPHRKREIMQGVTDGKTSARLMRAKSRPILLGALRDSHRWLDELRSVLPSRKMSDSKDWYGSDRMLGLEASTQD